jgi:type II secretory pathway predicted ATPase ExeA
MFLEFYGLREQPFGVTPDPRYLYLSSSHREALAALFCGIESGRGFLSLIAKPGMGKTTILFQLLQRRKGYVHSAFLFQTQCDAKELIRYLMQDLGLNCDSGDLVRMHAELNQFLFREALAGRSVVVFIDEAQNLTDSALEAVRLLSNFEATDKKLLQIVLAGQPELAQRLMRPEMAQLRQRIAMHARLDPLSGEEVIPYIRHRLQVAGYKGPELFTPGALALIAERSGGIPRLINHLCFTALSTGCGMKRKLISSDIVREAANDLCLESPATAQPMVEKSETQASTFAPRAPLQGSQMWVRDSLFTRRFLQALVLLFLFPSLTIFFGKRARAKPNQPVATIQVATARTYGTATSNLSAGPETANQSGSEPQPVPVANSVAQAPRRYFTYVVQPEDTLRDVCVSGLGSYNKAVLQEVRRLNPSLRNADHLEVGQKIRLPVYSMN